MTDNSPNRDFALRNLPPDELLPAAVRDAAKGYVEARARRSRAEQDRTHHEQVELAAARARDVEALADAQEAHKAAPEPQHERKARDQLADLARRADAAALVERRASVRLEQVMADHADAITAEAERRIADARAAYVEAVDALSAAADRVAAASGLAEWARDTTKGFRVRGLRIPIGKGSDKPAIAQVEAGLRLAVDPPPPRYPSGQAIPPEQGKPVPPGQIVNA